MLTPWEQILVGQFYTFNNAQIYIGIIFYKQKTLQKGRSTDLMRFNI